MLLPMGEKSAPPTMGDITLGDMNSAHSIDRSLSSLLPGLQKSVHSSICQAHSITPMAAIDISTIYSMARPMLSSDRLQGQDSCDIKIGNSLDDGGRQRQGLQIVSAVVKMLGSSAQPGHRG